MPDSIIESAPAKVNLALHVTGRRGDGYHLLDTLAVFTQAGDRITVTPADEDRFAVTGPFAADVPGGGDNLVIRARDLMRGIAGRPTGEGVAITLEKDLPVASGIGGGSSDAAATLRALARLWDPRMPEAQLAEAALALGADLPMCLAARTLRARGVGEIIEPVRGWPALDMVLVNPGVAVATPTVFAALESRDNQPLPPLPEPPGFPAILAWLRSARNNLEAPALSLAPVIGEALYALRSGGAALARMSGSGATCFGLYPTPGMAERAAAAIAKARPAWYVTATTTIERIEADGAH